MKIKRYKEFKSELIQEAEEDEFGLEPDEEGGEDAPADEEGGDLADEEGGEETGDEEGGEEEEEKPFNDSPEVYVTNAITKLQTKLEGLFDDEEPMEDVDNPMATIGPEGASELDRSKREKKNKESMTLKDMGAKLESSDVMKTSKTHKSLVMKFSDSESYYALYIKLSLKEALDLIGDGEELTDESIQKAYVKMKKVSLDDYKEVGTVNRNVMVADINEDFIIELKLELDGESGGGDEEEEEEFSIET
jgi:hypothetical protein